MSNGTIFESLWPINTILSEKLIQTYNLTAGASDFDIAPRPLIYDILILIQLIN